MHRQKWNINIVVPCIFFYTELEADFFLTLQRKKFCVALRLRQNIKDCYRVNLKPQQKHTGLSNLFSPSLSLSLSLSYPNPRHYSKRKKRNSCRCIFCEEKRSPRGQRMPGSPSAAGLHEVLQLLGEYLAGRLRHRSHRIPVLHQLRPQLGVAERVHRHLVSRTSDRVPERDETRNSKSDGRQSYHDVAGRLRFADARLPLPFISIDDQSPVVRRLRARDARSPLRSSRTSAHVDDSYFGRIPMPYSRTTSFTLGETQSCDRTHHHPAVSFRTVRLLRGLPSSTAKQFNSLGN